MTDASELEIDAIADVDQIKYSPDFWKASVQPESQITVRPLYVSFELAKATLLTTLHNVLAALPDVKAIHAKVFLVESQCANTVRRIAGFFDYTRGFYKNTDGRNATFPGGMPNAQLEEWFNSEVQQELSLVGERILTPEDVLLDKHILKGNSIAVSGYTTCIGDTATCMLYSDPLSLIRDVYYDADSLSRVDRRNFFHVLSFRGAKSQ